MVAEGHHAAPGARTRGRPGPGTGAGAARGAGRPGDRALEEILRRGVERGEVAAGNPALEYVPAQIFGVLRVRPLLDGRNADAEYLIRFVEAAVLPALGLA
ncbi:hypothetical protein GCM10023238_03760 [Streptomyces heliomycini]